MNIQYILAKTHKVIADNSPAILTAIGVTGTLTTAYLTGKATFHAAEILRDNEHHLSKQKANRDLVRAKVELIWQLYIPAVTTAALTCACIIGANRIGSRRTAAMAAAYSLSERAFGEYRSKVVEKIGEKKEQAVRDEVQQDRFIAAQSTRGKDEDLPGDGDTLCLDTMSGRFFMSTMETLRRAENDINFQILHTDFATVSDYYNKVGLKDTSVSSELGWNTDKKLELHFSGTLDDKNQPCMVVDFGTVPIREPWRYI